MTAVPPTLSWILPLYRTAEHLDELLARIAATSETLAISYEVVLVDDACPEGSGAAAERASTEFGHVGVVRLASNAGQDGALRAGLRVAKGAWAVLLDADLQDPPEAVAALWVRAQHGYDAVFARREGVYTTPIRHFTSRIYRSLMSRVAGLPPGACLFVLVNRRLIEAVAATSRPRPSILAIISANRPLCESVAVERAQRSHGRSAYTIVLRLDKALGSLWQVILHRHLRVPP